MKISAAAFKAECLKLMDQVERTGEPVIITKHGRPVAQLVPIPVGDSSLFGYMKHTLTVRGDVVSPVGVPWEASQDSGARRIPREPVRPRLHK